MSVKHLFKKSLLVWIMLMTFIQAKATSESLSIYVGETKTLTVPSIIQNYGIITYFSIEYTNCLQKVSTTKYSITVKGLKASTGEIRITCNYQLSTLETGEHVFRVTVKNNSSGTPNAGEKDEVSIPTNLTLEIGESQSVTAVSNAGESVIWDWLGDDNKIVTKALSGRYYQTATFTGIAEGETHVYAKSNKGGMAKMDITVVQPVKAESLDLHYKELSLPVGSECTINATVTPANATDAALTWSSDNPSIVSVDGNGTVKALAVGATIITATTKGGLMAKCNIQVTEKPTIPSLIISDSEGLTDIPEIADVTYTRQLFKGWNSFCLPFTIQLTDFPEGCSIAVFDGPERENGRDVLKFSDCKQVDAGIPFLVHAPQDMTFNYNAESVALVSTPLNGGTAKGVFTRTVIGPECYKLNPSGTAFGITKTGDAICAPFRIYIPINNK